MASNIIPFRPSQIPAHIRALQATTTVDNSAFGQTSAGFPVIAIKSHRFSMVQDGKRTIINDPRTDEPANHITVVIMRTNPAFSKAYYAEKYVEGSDAKPDCFSNDGIRPDPQSAEKQAKTCALCPFNAFGSSDTGRGKACPDSKRLAVATPDRLDNPALLRVPPTSLKNLAKYAEKLSSMSADVRWVATKIGFDPQATHQVLTFEPVGFLDGETIQKVIALQDDEILLRVTGEKLEQTTEEDAPADKPTPRPVRSAPVAPKEPDPRPRTFAKQEAAPVEEEDEDDLEEAPAPVKTAKPRVRVRQEATAPVTSTVVEEIGEFLEAGFDDM